MPKTARIAALVNPTNQNAAADTMEAEAAARTLGLELLLRGCLTANLARVFSHHLFDAEKQGSEIGGIFQMPADVVGIGGAKNTTHFPDGAFSDAGMAMQAIPRLARDEMERINRCRCRA